ncbi:MAG TPA: sigma-70 family RNA polymerase sigma factor [Allosphingosinicella sp.]|uniref:sigma-70 family RNA polymerase sigma factor n=1 Tax=Allosphingosinicella sp. TaxID=2823234 RepID=UPI002F2722EE
MNEFTHRPEAPTPSDKTGQARARLVEGLQRVAAGDRAALRDVYSATSAKLFGVCLRILPDRQEAEDALQEAYLTVWRNADRFDAERASPITWLVALTRNKALDRLRGRKALPLEPIDLANEVPDTADAADFAMERDQEGARLGVCLGRLDSQDNVLIRAAFFEGSSYSELATRASQPLGTIKSRIRRALLKLRECLSQ